MRVGLLLSLIFFSVESTFSSDYIDSIEESNEESNEDWKYDDKRRVDILSGSGVDHDGNSESKAPKRKAIKSLKG